MQVVMYELLDAWGHDGLITHVKKMQTDYKNRAAIVQEAAGLFLICGIDLASNCSKPTSFNNVYTRAHVTQ